VLEIEKYFEMNMKKEVVVFVLYDRREY